MQFSSPWRTAHLWIASGALIAVVALAPDAAAHKWASSQFEARTLGRAIDFRFQTNATSIEEMLVRTGMDEAAVDVRHPERHSRAIADYFSTHFSVYNDDRMCPVSAWDPPRYGAESDKVVVHFRVLCDGGLHQVVLRSSLFIQEETEHRIIGTFIHKYAREQYAFAGTSEAVIPVDRLRQLRRPGTFRVVGPPRGVPFRQDKVLAQQGRRPAPDAAAGGADAAPKTAPGAQEKKDGTAYGSAVALSGWRATLGVFLKEGVKHILSGLDHVLFVLMLLVAATRWRQLAWVITSFTAAHTITLVLSALDVIRISPLLVEPMVAATIAFVAAENVLWPHRAADPKITFWFGLIHGLGFGSVLQRDLGLYKGQVVVPLLGFNLGVEVGQLACVAALFPLVAFWRGNPPSFRKAQIAAGAVVGAAALWWFTSRVWGAISRLTA